MENVNFYTFDGICFPVSRPILLKLHIARLIERLAMTYGAKSGDKEKLSILLEAHHKAQSSEIFLHFPPKIKRAVIFYLLPNPTEPAYLSFRDRELSNMVWLVQFRRRKVAVHTILGWSQADMLRRPSRRNYRNHNFFVLGPILVKFHIWTRLIEGFPTIFRTWWCAEVKLHFTPFHTLCHLKHDKALLSPLGS